jgi:hypothetical protein
MNKKIADEFIEFMSDDIQQALPKQHEDKVLTALKNKIAPSIDMVWPKFVFAQLVAAAATLSVCPQFGVGPITGGHGLGHVFMRFGEVGCAIFCGIFFLATGTALASLMMRPGQRREVFNYRFRILGAVSVMSFLFLMGAGKTLEREMMFNSIGANIAWIVAATLSSLAILHLFKNSAITSFAQVTKK